MKRREFIGLVSAALALPALGRPAMAQAVNQLKIMVPSGPGGGWDTTGRTVEQVLRGAGLIGSARVTNIPGAGGTIGLATFVNQNRNDAQAILVGGLVMATNIISNRSAVDLSMVRPLARLTGEYQAVAVPAASPYATLGDLLDDFRAKKRGVSWVGGSAGGTDHIMAALIAKAVGIGIGDLTYVGYPSGGEIQAAVLGAQASVGVSGLSEFSEHAAGGGMRILAVSAPERIPGVDVPTLREAGVDVELVNWRGLFAAPDISDEDQARLLGLVEAMVETPEWKAELERRNWTSTYLGGAEFGAFLEAENARLKAVLAELGLT